VRDPASTCESRPYDPMKLTPLRISRSTLGLPKGNPNLTNFEAVSEKAKTIATAFPAPLPSRASPKIFPQPHFSVLHSVRSLTLRTLRECYFVYIVRT
jgi:hypothetical protein